MLVNKTFLITGASSGLGEKFSLLIADIAKNINTLLVKEYMKEYRGEAA